MLQLSGSFKQLNIKFKSMYSYELQVQTSMFRENITGISFLRYVDQIIRFAKTMCKLRFDHMALGSFPTQNK